MTVIHTNKSDTSLTSMGQNNRTWLICQLLQVTRQQQTPQSFLSIELATQSSIQS